MEAMALNKYQKHVVDIMANVDEAQQMEISNLISNYFAKKAFDAADELWDKGMIGEQTIEELKHEHMRTPYHDYCKSKVYCYSRQTLRCGEV